MTDENQNPQNQENPQVQDKNQATAGDDFDLFGGDDDIFENPDLLKGVEEGDKDDVPQDTDIFVEPAVSEPETIAEPTPEPEVAPEPEIIEPETMETETPEEDFDDFDDDIDVDYRDEEGIINNEEGTMNNEEGNIMSSGVKGNETKDINLDSSSQAPQNDNIEAPQNDNIETPQNDNIEIPQDDDVENPDDEEDSEPEFYGPEDFDPIPEVDDGTDYNVDDFGDDEEGNNEEGNNEEGIMNNEEGTMDNMEGDNMSSGVEGNETKDINLDSSLRSEGQEDSSSQVYTDSSAPQNDNIKTPQNDDTNIPEPEKEEIFEPDENKSVLQNKFLELKFETEKIFRLVNKDFSKGFDLLGGNDDMKKITYKIFVDEDTISIDKIELNKADETTQTHNLEFGIEDNSLGVYVDSEFLYDEVDDLQNDKNKAMQVIDKLNKFIFLVTDEYKKIEKEKKLKERNNHLKGTFRDF